MVSLAGKGCVVVFHSGHRSRGCVVKWMDGTTCTVQIVQIVCTHIYMYTHTVGITMVLV